MKYTGYPFLHFGCSITFNVAPKATTKPYIQSQAQA